MGYLISLVFGFLLFSTVGQSSCDILIILSSQVFRVFITALASRVPPMQTQRQSSLVSIIVEQVTVIICTYVHVN